MFASSKIKFKVFDEINLDFKSEKIISSKIFLKVPLKIWHVKNKYNLCNKKRTRIENIVSSINYETISNIYRFF